MKIRTQAQLAVARAPSEPIDAIDAPTHGTASFDVTGTVALSGMVAANDPAPPALCPALPMRIRPALGRHARAGAHSIDVGF